MIVRYKTSPKPFTARLARASVVPRHDRAAKYLLLSVVVATFGVTLVTKRRRPFHSFRLDKLSLTSLAVASDTRP